MNFTFGIITGIAVFSIALVMLIITLWHSMNLTRVVKAGSADDFQWKHISAPEQIPEIVEFEGKTIYPKDDGLYMRIFLGESMHRYGIHNLYRGLFRKLTNQEKLEIKDMPIVEFEIHEHPWRVFFESRYKLRKFIGYLPKINIQKSQYDFDALYEQFHKEIRVPKDVFIEECERRIKVLKEKGCKDEQLVLSETFDCDRKKDHYSIHRASSLNGRLEFFYSPQEMEEKYKVA